MIHWLYLLYLCICTSHIITPLVNSSMYSYVTHRQVKGMVTLNLFIESPLQKHCIRYMRKGTSLLITCPQLTCRTLTTTGCCCITVAATLAIM